MKDNSQEKNVIILFFFFFFVQKAFLPIKDFRKYIICGFFSFFFFISKKEKSLGVGIQARKSRCEGVGVRKDGGRRGSSSSRDLCASRVCQFVHAQRLRARLDASSTKGHCAHRRAHCNIIIHVGRSVSVCSMDRYFFRSEDSLHERSSKDFFADYIRMTQSSGKFIFLSNPFPRTL